VKKYSVYEPEMVDYVGKKRVVAGNLYKSHFGKRNYAQFHHMVDLTFSEMGNFSLPGEMIDALEDAFGITTDEMIQILHVSKSTYYQILKTRKLSRKHLEILISIAKIFDKGVEAFEDLIDFRVWLHEANVSLKLHLPSEMISSEQGRREVEEAIERIEHGIYA